MIKPIILVSLVCFCFARVRENEVPKLVIDNDAGADDAMAIFLALLNEKHFNGPKLVGLTTVNGNTKEDNVAVNNQRILKVAKRQDVPIYRGSKESLVITPQVDDFFGEDGLGDIGEELTDLVPPSRTGAVTKLLELSHTYEGHLTVATLGSLTNVALALQLDPNFLGRLEHLYVGAGHVYGEDFPQAEFNAHMDVEAYHIVAKHATPDKVTVLPFSQVMTHLNITRKWREEVFGKIDTDMVRALNGYERLTLPKSESWHALDPAVLALATRPDLVREYRYSKNDIILCGDQRGINTNSFVDEKEECNIRMIYSIKIEEYMQYLLDTFGADVKKL